MLRLIKLWYWRWVVSCCKEDMEEIRYWIPLLKGENKRLAIVEHKQIIRDVIKAQRRVLQLTTK